MEIKGYAPRLNNTIIILIAFVQNVVLSSTRGPGIVIANGSSL
jgi:hypothetical protein